MTQVLKQFINDEPVIRGDVIVVEHLARQIQRKIGSNEKLVVIVVDRMPQDDHMMRTNLFCFWDFSEDYPLAKIIWGLVSRIVMAARGVKIPL